MRTGVTSRLKEDVGAKCHQLVCDRSAAVCSTERIRVLMVHDAALADRRTRIERALRKHSTQAKAHRLSLAFSAPTAHTTVGSNSTENVPLRSRWQTDRWVESRLPALMRPRPSSSRIRRTSRPCNQPAAVKQRMSANGRYPFQNCRLGIIEIACLWRTWSSANSMPWMLLVAPPK
eukprot:4041455-Prymnesium_polylepis.1